MILTNFPGKSQCGAIIWEQWASGCRHRQDRRNCAGTSWRTQLAWTNFNFSLFHYSCMLMLLFVQFSRSSKYPIIDFSLAFNFTPSLCRDLRNLPHFLSVSYLNLCKRPKGSWYISFFWKKKQVSDVISTYRFLEYRQNFCLWQSDQHVYWPAGLIAASCGQLDGVLQDAACNHEPQQNQRAEKRPAASDLGDWTCRSKRQVTACSDSNDPDEAPDIKSC